MAEFTPRLGLRGIAQTELPHAFNSHTVCKLDSAGVTYLESTQQTTPPASPSFGDTYYVSSGDVGSVWEGFEDVMAYWTGGAWETYDAVAGLVGYNRETNLVVTRQNGSWVNFDESIVITSTLDIKKPDAFVHAGVQRYQFTPTSGGSVTTEFGIGPLFTMGATGSSNRPGSAGGSRSGFLTIPASDKAQLYPLYRYVGDFNGTGGSVAPTMPKLLSYDIRVDMDSSVVFSFPMMNLVLVRTDSQSSQRIDTWDNGTVAGYQPIDHSKDDEFWAAETVLTLDRPVVPANTGRHVVQYSGDPVLSLEPGYLMLQVNGSNSEFGKGTTYGIRNTVATVTANLTVSADF